MLLLSRTKDAIYLRLMRIEGKNMLQGISGIPFTHERYLLELREREKRYGSVILS